MMEFVARENPIARLEFDSRLRAWSALAASESEMVGDVDSPNQKRTPWIWVRNGSHVAKLHADTCAMGVRRYLALLDRDGPGLTWTIVPSQKGRLTKIAFGPELEVIKGFYLYVPEQLD